MDEKLTVVYRLRLDRAKLDAYALTLYDGPPDDPYPDDLGLGLVRDWVEESRGRIAEGAGSVDTVWWEGPYMEDVSIVLVESDTGPRDSEGKREG